MRSAPPTLSLLVPLLLLAPVAAFGQQGGLPWHPGDAPPVVAGLRLGASRAEIDSVMGKPQTVRTVAPGMQVFAYGSRRVGVLFSQALGLAAVYLGSPDEGDVGGVRVGDSDQSVAARWGQPASRQDNLDVYGVGAWYVALALDSTRTRVTLLAVARADEPTEAAEGPYDSTADAPHDIETALQTSRGDHKLVLLDFGANWCLDCLVLDRLFQDSTVAPFLASHFRVVHVDVGQFDRNLDVSDTYGSPIGKGVPAVVVLSPSGEVVASTKDGSLEAARNETAAQILQLLQTWAAAVHH